MTLLNCPLKECSWSYEFNDDQAHPGSPREMKTVQEFTERFLVHVRDTHPGAPPLWLLSKIAVENAK